MINKIISLCFVSLLMIGATGVTYGADTHYVSLAGTNDSPYTNGWASAATNIQWAVDQAIADDTVLVSNGTYNLTNQISITANITVRSFTEQGHGTNDTIVDGGYPDRTNGRCFYMTAGTLDGFTIRNGYTNTTVHGGGGGGVKMQYGGNVVNCYIYSNQAISVSAGWTSGGGGINAPGFSGIISNCTIVGNAGFYGGGIQVYPCSGGLIVGCRVSENWAYRGGGVYTTDGAIIITNCTVDGNTADNCYGGMYITCVGGLITDCVISNNTCTNGACGGVAVGAATLRNSLITHNTTLVNNYAGVSMIAAAGGVTLVSNCLVIANTSLSTTGGIYLDGRNGSGVIADCTISGNFGGWVAGNGVYILANGTYPQLMKNCLISGNTGGGGGVRIMEIGQYPYGLINCTIADNTSGNGIYADAGTNNYIENCIVYGTGSTIFNTTAANTNNYLYNCTTSTIVVGQGNTTNNPLFIDTVNGNYRLSVRSPCINTGTNGNWTATDVDLDGRTRIRYGTVDMGAYEFIRSGTIFGFH